MKTSVGYFLPRFSRLHWSKARTRVAGLGDYEPGAEAAGLPAGYGHKMVSRYELLFLPHYWVTSAPLDADSDGWVRTTVPTPPATHFRGVADGGRDIVSCEGWWSESICVVVG